MANETIYGCYNKSDGSITYAQDSCEYPACYVVSDDEHNGQIAVTVNTNICDDTYYGCIDMSGKFAVSVPDNCCTCICKCSKCDYTDDCYQPDEVYVGFDGISACDPFCYAKDGDGFEYIYTESLPGSGVTLTHSGSSNCIWTNLDVAGLMHTEGKRWQETDCTGSLLETVQASGLQVILYVVGNKWILSAVSNSPFPSQTPTISYFSGQYDLDVEAKPDCNGGVMGFNNALSCGANIAHGAEGGTAVVTFGSMGVVDNICTH